MPHFKNPEIEKLAGHLRGLGREHPEVLAVYLFGSSASRKAGPLSDLDVAVLLDESRLKPGRRFHFRLDLIGEAMGASHRPDVDLVLLNEASPLLAYEVIRGGRLLFERRRQARVEFESRAVGRYLDLKPFYRVSRRYLKKQMLRRGRNGQP